TLDTANLARVKQVVADFDSHLTVTFAITPTGNAALLIYTPDGLPAQRIRVGGNLQSTKVIVQPRPVYPPLAKQAHIEGQVKLLAEIGADGTVQNLTVISGHPLLVPAAVEAVKQWVYQTTLLNGQPVGVETEIDVNFTLAQ
ncbi:MAG: energy transducer TonB, partial [Acidobacteriia bacterium]|nr:energy transducer TonB [Terriglobia bacterium]